MPDPTQSRTLLNCGTEMTGYPPTGLPLGPTLDPITADNRPNPQVPAPVRVISLIPTPTNSPTDLTLTWAVDSNMTDPLGWSNSAPSPAPTTNYNQSGYRQSWIDQWTDPFVEPGFPAPDSFNIYQVFRGSTNQPSYVFVKNVSGGSSTSTTLTLPAANEPGTYEYTVTGVKAASSSYVGGEGPFPRTVNGGVNPQYVVPIPTDIVVVTNPNAQSNYLGDTVSLQIAASDTTSGTLAYTATPLPAGVTINSGTGLISGSPTTPQVATNVLVEVQNTATGSIGYQTFPWTVLALSPASVPGTPTPSSITSTGATLTWTAPSGPPSATGYNVYDTTAGTPGTKLTTTALSSSTLTYNVTNGVADTTRTYAVTSLNGNAESAESTAASVLFLPGVPTALTNGTPTTTTASLSWTAPTGGATSYNVYDTTSAHPGTKLNGSAITVTNYTVTNGVTGTTRKYAVTAVNASGESAETSDLSVTFA